MRILIVGLVLALFNHGAFSQQMAGVPPYVPASHVLYNTITRLDSLWGDSYNNCKLDVQQHLISEDLEFYHDLGGLMTSKKQLLDALTNNICGKVRRELLQGSIEVYEIKNYGAVEMGYHRFISKGQQGTSQYARFVHLWQHKNNQWQITRVISLH